MRKFGKRNQSSGDPLSPRDRFGKRMKNANRNRGVEQRGQRDRTQQGQSDDDSDSRKARQSHDSLVAKAALYDKVSSRY